MQLEGGYELREILEAEESVASFRVRVLGDYTQKAFAKFFTASADASHEQVAIWDTVRGLRDKNLSAPLGAGVVHVANVPVEYAVIPAPDETLAGVLRERPLTPEEARELMCSMVSGLETLHANGFAHGRVSPEEVLAVGDSIQLSTEAIRPLNALPLVSAGVGKYLAPESIEQNVTAAADVWCLGATLFETLKARAYSPDVDIHAEGLPQAFVRVLACCLEKDPAARSTLAQVRDLYSGKAVPAPQPTVIPPPAKPIAVLAADSAIPAVVPEQNGHPHAAAEPVSESHALREDVPPARPAVNDVLPAVDAGTQPHPSPEPIVAPPNFSSTPLVYRRVQREDETAAASDSVFSRKAWMYGIGAAVVLLAVLLIARGRHDTKQPTVTKNAPAASSAAKPTSAWPTRTLSPDTPAAKQPSAAAAQPTAGNGQVWHVVLYTYGRQQDAEKRAATINQKHSALNAQVFSPAGSGRYLVTAGGGMTRDEAQKERRAALRAGMPHDSYIQNYNR